SQLERHPVYRPDAELVFPANLLEQLHLRSPLHPKASCLFRRMLRLAGGGPIYSIEVGQITVSKSALLASLETPLRSVPPKLSHKEYLRAVGLRRKANQPPG